MAIDYKQSGVDIEAGEALVDWLKANQPTKWPHQERMVSGLGGFAALFRADFTEMKEPCLVSCTDGVGTKLKLASHFGRYREVAQDLVAMCVNDLICSGAMPLFFLDYYACGRLELEAAKDFLGGIQQACVDSNCALIGGETAEMPGVYADKDFDCAGFSVGVVDKPKALGAHLVKAGDRLIGLPSSGFHSNGFSLLRRVFEEDLDQWEDVLLTPTTLYVKIAHKLFAQGGVHSVAHITGGGLDNLLRVLPHGHQAQLKAWSVPAPFKEVKKRSEQSWDSMLRTLNCGLGLVLVVDSEQADKLMQVARAEGSEVLDLGHVEAQADAHAEASWVLETEALGE